MSTAIKENIGTLTLDNRIKLLREKKIEHTRKKVEVNGYMDGDDYGTVPLPEDWTFEVVPNHTDGKFYGPDGWAENFVAFMKAYPVYVDPLEMLAGRWREMLIRFAGGWRQDLYSYEHLIPEQEKYGIGSGIGADSHFSGDFSIGLELGWGGLRDKINKFRKINPGKQDFYDCEEKIIDGVQIWIKKHIDEIERLLEIEDRPEIVATLEKMLECNRHVITEPPRTFLEAAQWVAWFASVSRTYNRDGAGFNLDVLLLPYYRTDREAGILDEEEAKFIIANLLLVDTHYYQVSGAAADDGDLTNELSWLVLDAAFFLHISMHSRQSGLYHRRHISGLMSIVS